MSDRPKEFLHKEDIKGANESQRLQEMKHKDPKTGGSEWTQKQHISGEKNLGMNINERQPEQEGLQMEGKQVFHAD